MVVVCVPWDIMNSTAEWRDEDSTDEFGALRD